MFDIMGEKCLYIMTRGICISMMRNQYVVHVTSMKTRMTIYAPTDSRRRTGYIAVRGSQSKSVDKFLRLYTMVDGLLKSNNP